VLIATFHCRAPARCAAFADERRVGADDGGGRETLIQPRRLAPRVPPLGMQSTSGGRPLSSVRLPGCVLRRGRFGLERRRGQRCAKHDLERITAIFTPGVLIATFRCAAPARYGAFADDRRVGAGDAGVTTGAALEKGA